MPFECPAASAAYAERLAAHLQRLLDAPVRSRPVFALIPPGSESTAAVAAWLARVAVSRVMLDCRRTPATSLLDRVRGSRGAGWALLFPEALQAGELADLLFEVARHGPPVCIGERPFWLSPGLRSTHHHLLDFRSFLFVDAELDLLVSASKLADAEAPGHGPDVTRHHLRSVAGAWPGMTEAVLDDLVSAGAGAGDDDPAPLVRLPACRSFFASGWLPLLAAHYSWLRQACRLPLLTMDLLAAIAPDIGTGVQECLLIGWIERRRGVPGTYRVAGVLEQFLLPGSREAADHRWLERAAAWYEESGHVPEAIECWATLGRTGELAAAVPGVGPEAGMQVRRAAGTFPGAAGSLRDVASAVAARQALGLRPGRDLMPAARRPIMGPAAELPAIQHLLKAIGYYQTRADDEVARALAAAVRAGLKPRQLSSVIDFVDLHLRPMVDPARQKGRLAAVLGGLRHAAPARQALMPGPQALNHRELQILELICEGRGNKEIAARLGIELSTVKWYGTRIYEKLGVRSRTQAIARARADGLFD